MTEEQIQKVTAAIVEALKSLDAEPQAETSGAGSSVRVVPAEGKEPCCIAIHIGPGATSRVREECC